MNSLSNLLKKSNKYNFITLLVAFLISVFLVTIITIYHFKKAFIETSSILSENIKYYLEDSIKEIKNKEQKYKNLHLKYISLLKDSDKANLNSLIHQIKREVENQLNTKVSVAIINKNLKISYTTSQKEIGLDLSQFEDAKITANYLINKNNDNIVNIEYPVYTPAANTFKIYTLSFIKEKNIFLQLGIDTSLMKHLLSLIKTIKPHNKEISLIYFADQTPLFPIKGSMIEFKNKNIINNIFKNNYHIMSSLDQYTYLSKIIDFQYLKDMSKPINASIILVVKQSKSLIYKYILSSSFIMLLLFSLIYYFNLKHIQIYKTNFLLPFIKILKSMKIHKFVEDEDLPDKPIKELNLLSKYYNNHLNELLTQKKHLKDALTEIKTLKKLVPICSSCKKIRGKDDKWYTIEEYLSNKFEMDFTHGICPDCIRELYPNHAEEILKSINKRNKK